MKLYHGTTSRLLPQIRAKGLRPRGNRVTNWKANPSHPDAVYLTNSYAVFYANAVCRGGDQLAILEIDTEKLNPFAFSADEDFLEQINRGKDGIPGDMYERTHVYREKLHEYQGETHHGTAAWASLTALGNCTYFGTIPPEAITRVALIEFKKAQEFVLNHFDPSIVLMNYRILGPSYRNSLNWLFEHPLEEESFSRGNLPTHRNGITIKELKDVETRSRR